MNKHTGIAVSVLLWASLLSPSHTVSATDLSEKLAPEDGVVLCGLAGWRSKPHWVRRGMPCTELTWFEPDFATVVFHVRQVGRQAVWRRELLLPVDPNRYPIFVLRYRARGMEVKDKETWISLLTDGTGPAGLHPVANHGECIANNEEHEIRRDLRKLGVHAPVRAVVLHLGTDRFSTMSGGEFACLAIAFLADPATTPLPLEDSPGLTVLVRGSDGKPLPGATVIMDSERINFARAAETDDSGKAWVNAPQNESGRHMLRIEKDGFVPAEFGKLAPDGRKHCTVTLRKAHRYGGRVVARDGRGLDAAVVLFSVVVAPSPGIRSAFAEVMPASLEGKWRSKPLPAEADGYVLRAVAPGYAMSNTRIPVDSPEARELDSGALTIKLDSGEEKGPAFGSVEGLVETSNLAALADLFSDRTESPEMRRRAMRAAGKLLSMDAGEEATARAVRFWLGVAGNMESPAWTGEAVKGLLEFIKAENGTLAGADNVVRRNAPLPLSPEVAAALDRALTQWRVPLVGPVALSTNGNKSTAHSVPKSYSEAMRPEHERPREPNNATAPVAGRETGKTEVGPGGTAGQLLAPGAHGRKSNITLPAPILVPGRSRGGIRVPAKPRRTPAGWVPEANGGGRDTKKTTGAMALLIPGRDSRLLFSGRGTTDVPSAGQPRPNAAALAPINVQAGGPTRPGNRRTERNNVCPMPTALVPPKRYRAATGIDTLLFDQTMEDILKSRDRGDGGTALRKFRKTVPDIASSVQVCSKALPILASLLPPKLTRDSQRLTGAFLACFPSGHINRRFALQSAALYCYRRHEFQRALQWLDCLDKEASKSNAPAQPDALLLHGLIELRMGNMENARRDFARVVSTAVGPETKARALFLIAWSHLNGQEFDKAKREFEELHRRFPETRYGRQAPAMLDRIPKERQP